MHGKFPCNMTYGQLFIHDQSDCRNFELLVELSSGHVLSFFLLTSCPFYHTPSINVSALCLQKRGKSCILLLKEVKFQDIAMTENMVEIRLKTIE